MIPDEVKNFLGLALRARKLALGYDAVARELGRNRVALLLVAQDFSAAAKRRLLFNRAGISQITLGTKQEWGEFWGRKEVGVFAITDANFAAGLLQKLGNEQAR
jgi:ribosomal protein L7Ae-like RNA K-turn-binding protein